MRLLNKIAFWLITLIIFVSIGYKMFNVPITHDEASTVLNYFHYDIWEIMMYPDNVPNNHILNTIFGKIFSGIFGLDDWSVRVHSLIGYIIYIFAIYRIVKILFSWKSLFVISAIALFMTNPYLLDFFGLCRGYGLASAFVLLSSSFLLSGFLMKRERDIWISILFSILASYSNFTVLVFWAAITILSIVYFFINYRNDMDKILKKGSVLAFVSLLYLGLIFVPIKKMTSTDQFQFWSSKGFFKETILSSVRGWVYNDRLFDGVNYDYLGIVVVIVFILSAFLTVRILVSKGIKKGFFEDPISLSFLILATTIAVSQLQILILHTPDLEGRIAVFLFPLFALVLVSLLTKMESVKYIWLKIFVAVLIPVFLFMHLSNSYNPRSVREWWYDENTFDVLNYLNDSNPKNDVTLKTYWIFYNSFDFYNKIGKIKGVKLLSNSDINVNLGADYYYIEEGQLKKLESKYEKVKMFGWGRWLMKKKEY